jgi:hypothetical protein
MSLCSQVEAALRPLVAELTTGCAGCGGGLGLNRAELISGLRLCDDCIGDAYEDLYGDAQIAEDEAYNRGFEEGKEEAEREAEALAADATGNREESF